MRRAANLDIDALLGSEAANRFLLRHVVLNQALLSNDVSPGSLCG